MKRGRTELVVLNKNNYYGGKALVLAQDSTQGGTGGVQMELYRQLWGQLMTGDPNLNVKALDDVEYMQNIDLTKTYEGRTFEVVGDAITALIHNEKNNFLITRVAPIFMTDELNFQANRKEWNQIEYTRVSETGLGEETSFSQWNWTDKLERRKQEAKLSMELALDNNYGATVWAENLAVLASDGLLTLMKEAAYAIYTIGYSNMVEDKIRQIPVDLSRLYRMETRAFFCMAMGLDGFLQRIQDAADNVPGFDTVIMPYKTSHRLREMTGESRQMDAVIVSMNPQTQQYERQLSTAGPQSTKTVQLGNRTVDFFEMTGFRVNMRDDTIEDPSVARVTLCQCLPPNHDVHAEDSVQCQPGCSTLDMYAFYQQKDVGEDRRIPFKEMLKNCFAYDRRTGKPSRYVERLALEKNEKREAPWAFGGHGNRGYVAEDINDEDQNYDYETPDIQALGSQTRLNEMPSWRHDFFLLTWDPRTGTYRIPRLWGDVSLSAFPHAWFHRAIRQLNAASHTSLGFPLSQALAELRELVDDINAEAWTVDYATELIDTQMPFLLQEQRANGGQLPERWPTNEFGALRLPNNASGSLSSMVYPPGYGFGGGILTLAREANKPGSNWQEGGRRAKNVTNKLEPALRFMRKSMGQSEAFNGEYAEFASDSAAMTVLVASALGHFEPVYMAVPSSGDLGQADISVSGGVPQGETERGRGAFSTRPDLQTVVIDGIRTAADIGAVVAALQNGLRPNEALRALFSLNGAAILQVKGSLLEFFNTALSSAKRAVLESLFTQIFAIVPYEQDTNERRVKIASALAVDVTGLLDAGDPEGALALIRKMANKTSAMAKEKEWAESGNQFYASPVDPAIRDALKRAEQSPSGGQVQARPVERTGTQRRETARTVANARTQAFFQGNYNADPAAFLIAPLAASESLDEFIETTGFSWIRPANPITGKAYFDEDEVANREARIEAARKKLRGLHRLAGVFHAFQGKRSDGAEEMDMDESQGGGFFGLSGQFMGLQARPVGRRNVARKDMYDGLENAFFGPWRERLRFISTLESEAEQLIGLALLQLPNTLETHLNLADHDVQLMNVILFRPWIECTAKSVVVMEAGTNTLLTGMSRAKAIVSKEDRGIIHIGSSFYTGSIRVNPGNIELLPLCDPDRFLGGKNHSFITHEDQWSAENPLKPSIIALPTPVGERTYGEYVEMTNQQLYLRPGIDVDGHFCKYSSAEFYKSIFGLDRTDTVQDAHAQRLKYWSFVDVSHVGHVGPRSFIDARTGLRVDYEGHGPGNDRRMNQPGAEKVWNGQASEFPQLVPLYSTRQRV